MIKKIILSLDKKEYIEDLKRSVVLSEGKKYYVETLEKDFHCSDGFFKKEDLQKDSGIILSNKGKEFFIFDASFIDSYKGIKKSAQTIPLKDIGFIMSETGIGKDSVIVDTGAGSGGSACFFARHVKQVYAYDINDVNIRQTQENINYFDLKNITVEKINVYEEIPAKNVDMILLDLPEPWRAISPSMNSLKVGGFLVTYCPQIIQTQTVANSLHDLGCFIHVKTVEVVERDWKVEGQIVRPRSLSNIHSGFVSVFRKIKSN